LYLFGIMLTTCVATLATTPISLYYFHTLTLNAVWANLIAIPLTSLVIMPLCLICVLSYFIFQMDWPFILLKYSIDMLTFIAKTVSAWPGSSLFVHQPPKLYMLLFGFGFLWLCFFATQKRFYGLIPIIGAFLSLNDTRHLPDIYLSDQGTVVGFRKGDTFYVSSKRGGFFHEQWQKELGIKKVSMMKPSILSFQGGVTLLIDPYRIDDELLLNLECPRILLTNGYWKHCRDQSVLQIDRNNLQERGTHQIWLNPFRIVSVRQSLGKRPWIPS
ncbi:MAG: ComEC/Rec2 family competence protein, partial [Alphaproteobacteria bacterium]|nr:ComEC/Rec2 family competence protein [Alphaproteobacteria bacterium]